MRYLHRSPLGILEARHANVSRVKRFERELDGGDDILFRRTRINDSESLRDCCLYKSRTGENIKRHCP